MWGHLNERWGAVQGTERSWVPALLGVLEKTCQERARNQERPDGYACT